MDEDVRSVVGEYDDEDETEELPEELRYPVQSFAEILDGQVGV